MANDHAVPKNSVRYKGVRYIAGFYESLTAIRLAPRKSVRHNEVSAIERFDCIRISMHSVRGDSQIDFFHDRINFFLGSR